MGKGSNLYPDAPIRWRRWLAKIPNYDVFANSDDYFFDAQTADYVCDFIETRIHWIEGERAGELVHLEDWQRAILGAIFGFKKKADGLRRYNNVWLYIPRKNIKTTLMAIIAIIMLTLENEPGAQNIAAGADEEQATYILNIIKRMVEMDDDLAQLIDVRANQLFCDTNVLKVVSANYRAKHGKNVNFAAIDEVHEHPNADLVNALTTSAMTRRQPLFIEATTAAEEGESYCNDRHEYAKSVRDGVISAPNFLPIIYELTDPKRWKHEKAWKEVNPNYGISIKPERMRELCIKAQQMPSFYYEFCRLHLNMKVAKSNRWIDLFDWDKCSGLENGETPIQWRERVLDALKGQMCWGGLDLASTSDLTAFVLLFDGAPAGYDDSIILIPWCWVPERNVEHRGEEYRESYIKWVEEGYLLTTPGNVIDFANMRGTIDAMNETHPIMALAIDNSYQGVETSTYLQDSVGINMVAFRQGFHLFSAPMMEMEVAIKNKRIVHGGNPLLRWQFGNVVAERNGTQQRPVKENKNSPRKIDAVVASLMAYGCYSQREKDMQTSAYNNPNNRLLIV